MRNVAEVLEAAASYIEEHGWCQRTLEDSSGRVCAVGAISKAPVIDLEGDQRYLSVCQLATFLYRSWIDSLTTVTGWNDSPFRHVEEVTSAMRATATMWRAEQRSAPIADNVAIETELV